MQNNTNGNDKFGPLTQDIFNAICEIVKRAYEDAESTISVNYEIPDGFVRVPEGNSSVKFDGENKVSVGEGIKTALSAALPACLAAVAMACNAPSVAVILLSGAGGVAGRFVQNMGGVNDSQLELKNIELEQLTKNDIRTMTEINKEKQQQFLSESIEEARKLCQEISDYESRMSSRYDVSIDRAFGEWVQSFLLYAEKNPEDRKLQKLRDMFLDRLSIMGIHVFDEVVLNEQGHPNVPYQDYLLNRSEDGSFNAIIKPAVYTDRALLARGEIQ